MAFTAKSYSGAIVAAANIVATPCTLYGIAIDAAATAVVTLWDNAGAAASGTILFQKSFPAAVNNYTLNIPLGLTAANGIAVTVATAAAEVSLAVG